MRLRASTALAAALVLAVPATSRADLATYGQNFESMAVGDLTALANDGWLVYGNVFTPALVFIRGYGPFPAPNDGAAFCAVDAGQGGPLQGDKQLSVYNDYNNTGDHTAGNLVEANVYQEQTIGAADVGNQWTFQFDAKRGIWPPPIVGTPTTVAFIKTIDPNNGFAQTNLVTVDMTSVPDTWNTYSISLSIDAGLVGQYAQFGFASTASNFDPTVMFYDNLVWHQTTGVDVPAAPMAADLALQAAAPNPFRGSTRIGYSIARRGPVDLGVFDVTGRRVATLYRGVAEAGPHATTWDGRSADGRPAPAGIYLYVLKTETGRQARSMVLSR